VPRELHGDPGQQGTEAEAAGRGDAADDRAEPLVVSGCVFHDRRGERTGGRAGRDALHRPGGDHPADAGREHEHKHGQQFDR
jgi:hypothetical protein